MPKNRKINISQHGDEDKTLKNLIEKLFKKDIINFPEFNGDSCIELYLENLERSLALANIDDECEKIEILISTLSENVRKDLKMQNGILENYKYSWITKKLRDLYGKK